VILHPGLVMAGLSGSFQAQTGIDAIAGRSSYRIDMVRAPQGIQAVNENGISFISILNGDRSWSCRNATGEVLKKKLLNEK
jgi:hypothetical protein